MECKYEPESTVLLVSGVVCGGGGVFGRGWQVAGLLGVGGVVLGVCDSESGVHRIGLV